ncbi:hypothetical protein GB931_01695 [Modestobacter sp. I12A-02628]|uniref:HEAT repeat protein n=1 Tax=Goekera deserti TaxID=2497753 RepID=A0A7K3WL80_9ACTN|nr:HEAT repeat domain-containing protein [Goekera deserti]MPQ96651.1 hypothetical protein [Goekera deserti]NDI47037.1 hypothetical protein [Goekera deserti]NEL56273.1 hypothetical protein [Goekera deserti]
MALADLVLSGCADPLVLRSAAEAAAADEVDAALAHAGHPDADVRLALTRTLADLGEPGPELLGIVGVLTGDADGRVRDWACFTLGTLWSEVDTPAVRDLLAARLDDEVDDVRHEALVGLAVRHDPRALPRVRAALSREDGSLNRMELTAAGHLADPGLHALVLRHQEGWDDDGPGGLADAVRRLTDPAGPGDDVLDGMAELCRRRGRGQPDGDALGSWRVLLAMLELAPHRAGPVFDAVLARLDGDDAAVAALHGSALAQDAGRLA